MATTPQIEQRDGSGYTSNLYFSTNQEAVTLRGKVSTETASIQVSVNGGPFITNPDYLKVELNTFTFPNPAVYPAGFNLQPGTNTLVFRTIDVVGGVSAPASVTVVLISDESLFLGEIPSGLQVRRYRNAVEITAATTPTFEDPQTGVTTGTPLLGFNFYASKKPAGLTGYYKINESLVTNEKNVYKETSLEMFEGEAFWQESFRQVARIRLTEEDEFGTELATRFNEVYDMSRFIDRAKFAFTFDNYTFGRYGAFRHNRSGGSGIINSDQWADVLPDQPLYYVVTGVYYDNATSVEYETPFSQEILGQPFIIDTAVLPLPLRNQTTIITSYIDHVTRVNSEVSLIPGSTTRDVSIDPFASEAERLWFLMDFVHRCQSFVTLVQMDDANADGVSDTVSTSAYKSALRAALGYTTDEAVQNLIDLQFEKLSKNVNKTRLPGRPATGQVVFYTKTKPTVDLIVPASTAVSSSQTSTFRVGGTYILPAASASSYYNYTTKRYEIIADIASSNPGSDTNLPAGSITTAAGVSGLSVTNTESTVGGTDRESNADLAARCVIAFASVDTGTEYGYYSTAIEQVGIIKTKIVKSGDRLMMRDWDPIRQKHVGGKVDVWVQGLRERQVSENFSFAFDLASNIECRIVDRANLVFRVRDSRVTPQTPIIEILNNPSQGYGVRNGTLGKSYDLTDVQVLDYQTFKLSTAVAQPDTAIDDLIYADYRFRSENKFILTFQPVRRIVSVVGEFSGSLAPESNYKLYKTSDPLTIGESTIAENYISVIQAAGKPSGTQFQVNDELHVLIGFVQESLDSIGINTKTIRVFNTARTIEFKGPEDTDPDFEIIAGTDRTPVKIVRTDNSTIATGQEVSVDYIKDENFTVTYVVNDLLQQLQLVLNTRRHVTADVIAKQAVVNPIDIETTVQLKLGFAKERVDLDIRSAVSQELNSRTIGQGIAQSDVINTVDSTTGVDYEIVPLARMAYSEGSLILREQILSESIRLTSLDIGGQRVFILRDALNYPTTDEGGLGTEHKGVFQDDLAMTTVSDLNLVGSSPNQAYIIGNNGAVIQGYTDDATLIEEGFTTAAARQTEYRQRTANHIVVALLGSGDPLPMPENYAYSVSYHVRGDKGAHDVYGSDVDYIDLGNLTITYRGA